MPSDIKRWSVWLTALLWPLACQTRAPAPASGSPSDVQVAPAPAPEPTPAPPSASAPPPPTAPPIPRPDYQQADIDPENDLVVAPPEPIGACEERLTAAGVRFRPTTLPLSQQRGKVFTCGAEQVVVYLGGPAAVRYNAAPTLTCRMALALARLEQLAEEQAQREFGIGIAKFSHMGTYSCRKMARFDWVSEHSYANAIDIETITLDNGRVLSVEKHFGKLTATTLNGEARFLRELANRAYDEELFSVVLTPYWDKLHRDHFHFDLARYRVDGTRPL